MPTNHKNLTTPPAAVQSRAERSASGASSRRGAPEPRGRHDLETCQSLPRHRNRAKTAPAKPTSPLDSPVPRHDSRCRLPEQTPARGRKNAPESIVESATTALYQPHGRTNGAPFRGAPTFGHFAESCGHPRSPSRNPAESLTPTSRAEPRKRLDATRISERTTPNEGQSPAIGRVSALTRPGRGTTSQVAKVGKRCQNALSTVVGSTQGRPVAAVFRGGATYLARCGCGFEYSTRVVVDLRSFSERPCPNCGDDHPKAWSAPQ